MGCAFKAVAIQIITGNPRESCESVNSQPLHDIQFDYRILPHIKFAIYGFGVKLNSCKLIPCQTNDAATRRKYMQAICQLWQKHAKMICFLKTAIFQ